MRTVISIVIIVAVVVMLTIDGLGMYAAHRTAVEVARTAADRAAETFVATGGNQADAQRMADGITREANAQLISAGYHEGTTSWYEVTVRAEPRSYFLKHLPYVERYLVQESTAVVHF